MFPTETVLEFVDAVNTATQILHADDAAHMQIADVDDTPAAELVGQIPEAQVQLLDLYPLTPMPRMVHRP